MSQNDDDELQKASLLRLKGKEYGGSFTDNYNVEEPYYNDFSDVEKLAYDYFSVEDEEPKDSMFSRLMQFFRRRTPRDYKEIDEVEEVNYIDNEFSSYIEDIEHSESYYDTCYDAVVIAGECYSLTTKKFNLLTRQYDNEKTLEDYKFLDKVSDEDIELLANLCENYLLFEKDLSQLSSQVASYDLSVANMEGKEKDAKKAMPDIQFAEKRRRLLNADISLIDDERENLIYESEVIDNAQKYTRIALYFLMFLFLTSSLIFAYLMAYQGYEVAIYLTAVDGIILAIIMGVFVFYRRLKTEKILNLKKQKKIVALKNKKTAVLASTKSYLDFAYKKYSGNSSEKIQKNLGEYESYKHLAKRRRSVERSANEIEEEIFDVFRKYKIPFPKMSIEGFYNTLNIKSGKVIVDNILLEQKNIDKEVDEIDTKLSKLLSDLDELKIKDNSPDKRVSEIIKVLNSLNDKVVINYREMLDEEA